MNHISDDRRVNGLVAKAGGSASIPAVDSDGGLLCLQTRGVLIMDDNLLQLRVLETIAQRKWRLSSGQIVANHVDRTATFDQVVDGLEESIRARLQPDGPGLAAIISDYDIAASFDSERVWREVHKRFEGTAEDAAWHNVARVLISATLNPMDRDRILGDRVMDAFVEKSFDMAHLTRLVCLLVSQRQGEAQHEVRRTSFGKDGKTL